MTDTTTTSELYGEGFAASKTLNALAGKPETKPETLSAIVNYMADRLAGLSGAARDEYLAGVTAGAWTTGAAR